MNVELLDWPISLDALNTSADFAFFTLTIPDPFPGTARPYGGILLAQGGADGSALDSLNDPTDAAFAVDVTQPTGTVPDIYLVDSRGTQPPRLRRRPSRLAGPGEGQARLGDRAPKIVALAGRRASRGDYQLGERLQSS